MRAFPDENCYHPLMDRPGKMNHSLLPIPAAVSAIPCLFLTTLSTISIDILLFKPPARLMIASNEILLTCNPL